MSMRMQKEPWIYEQESQEALEAHMAKFPTCVECGRSLMNCDVVVRIQDKYYCSQCVEVMTNSEMREAEGLE